jgi:hypothetical protein
LVADYPDGIAGEGLHNVVDHFVLQPQAIQAPLGELSKTFRKNLVTPLVTAKPSFDGSFELTRDDADILIQISGGAVLWQKERLLNLAIKSVPLYVKSIAWLDCDVIFDVLKGDIKKPLGLPEGGAAGNLDQNICIFFVQLKPAVEG